MHSVANGGSFLSGGGNRDRSNYQESGRHKPVPVTLIPMVAIEDPVVDGLLQVVRFDWVAGVQVGNGAGDAEDLVMSTCRQTEIVDTGLHDVLTGLVQRTVLAQLATRQVRVVDRPFIAEAFRF